MAKRKRKRKRKQQEEGGVPAPPVALCPVCSQPPGEPAQTCPECGSGHHASCWRGLKRCACGHAAGSAGALERSLATLHTVLSRPRTAALLLVGLAVACYVVSLWVPFLFDDAPVVTRNRMLWSWSGAWDLLKFKPTRFLTNLTFLINYRLAHGGSSPPMFGGLFKDVWSYHVVNVGLHALNGVLLYGLIRDLLRARRGLVSDRRVGIVALVGAAVWVAHPANTMAVAYISQRYALMAALAFLLTLRVYVRTRLRMEVQGRSPRDEVRGYALVLAGVTLALTTKENAAILPLAIVMVELLVFGGRQLVWTAAFFTPHALGALGFIGAFGLKQFFARFLPADCPTSDRLEYLITQAPITLRYLHLWLLPHDLTVEQAFPILWSSASGTFVKTHSEAPRVFALALAGHGLILAFVVKLLARGHRFIPLALAWFYVTNIVESSFIPILDPMVDHRMYLPLMLLPAAVAVAVARGTPALVAWSPRAKSLPALGAALLVTGLACATIARVTVWLSPIGIWKDTLSKRPDCARAYSSLGMEYLYAGNWLAAIGPIECAVMLGPYHVEGWNNLGKAYLELRQWRQAERALLRGIEVNAVSPSDSVKMCWNNVGLVYIRMADAQADPELRRGWLLKAVSHLRMAAKLDPLYETAYVNRSDASYQLLQLADGEDRKDHARDVVDAVARARKVAHMRGYELSLRSHRKLAFALLELEKPERAFQYLQELEPSFDRPVERVRLLNLLAQIALALHEEHEPQAASLLEEAAKELDAFMKTPAAKRPSVGAGIPGPSLRDGLLLTRGEVAAALGDRQRAIELLDEGLRKAPGHPRAEALTRQLEKLLSGEE